MTATYISFPALPDIKPRPWRGLLFLGFGSPEWLTNRRGESACAAITLNHLAIRVERVPQAQSSRPGCRLHRENSDVGRRMFVFFERTKAAAVVVNRRKQGSDFALHPVKVAPNADKRC